MAGKKTFKVVVKSEYCKGCNLCIEYCPKSVLVSSKELNSMGYHFADPVNVPDCTGCMTCTLVCPDVAIEVYDE
jgi:2-oxoglutarate ferredoxin oxidoreductase subunit delta